MKHTLLLPMLAALLLFGCTKDNDPPPEPTDRCPWPEVTTEGKNTLAFKINGVEWVPCVDLYAAFAGLRPIDSRVIESDGSNSLVLTGTRSLVSTGDSIIKGCAFHFRPLGVGKIDLEKLTSCKVTFYKFGNNSQPQEWSLPLSRQGLMLEILRLDVENNIISGIFEAILIPKIGNDTLFITEGRFDVTYTPQ
jgi:hypothetical protein